MNVYQPPTLTKYGDIATITGIFGSASSGDVLVDTTGSVVLNGDLSIDACPTQDFDDCHFDAP